MRVLSRGLSVVGFALVVGCNGEVVTEPAATPPPDAIQDRSGGDTWGIDYPNGKDLQQGGGDKGKTTQTTTLPPTLQANECASLVTTNGADHIARIDLAAGKLTIGPKLAYPDGSVLVTETEALGVIGGDLWFCSGISGSKVARAPLATGVVEKFDVPCRYVTADDSGIYVQQHNTRTILFFADAAAVATSTPTSTRPGVDTGALGMSAAGMIWDSYPGGGIHMASGDILALSGQSGSIWGVSEASGNRLIVGDKNGLVQAFDATTGSALGDVARFVPAAANEYGFWGMACAR